MHELSLLRPIYDSLKTFVTATMLPGSIFCGQGINTLPKFLLLAPKSGYATDFCNVIPKL